jgi:hypothetical protein
MKARLVKFGEIEVEGKPYTHDVVIDGGKVRKPASISAAALRARVQLLPPLA